MFEPLAECSLNGRTIDRETALRSGDSIQVGDSTELQFRIPSPLSPSATLQLQGSQRNADQLDGVVLFQQTCLIGPGENHHIPATGWEQTVILFERDHQLAWKIHQSGLSPKFIHHEETIEVGGNRIRAEAIASAN